MYIAFLFNSDDPKYGVCYGWPIMENVLGTRILQSAGYSIDIAHGDMPVRRHPELAQEYLSVTAAKECRCAKPLNIKTDRLHSIITTSTIYAWVLKGIKRDEAEALNTALWNDSAYVGAHEVDSSQQVHKALLIAPMLPLCRIKGARCTLFYSSFDGGERDEGFAAELLESEFVERIWWEDEDKIYQSAPDGTCPFPAPLSPPASQANPEDSSVRQTTAPEVTTGRNTDDRVVPFHRRGADVLHRRRR